MQPTNDDVQLVAQSQQAQQQFQQPMAPVQQPEYQQQPVQQQPQPFSQPYQADPVQQPAPQQTPQLPDYSSGIQGPVPGYQPPVEQQPVQQQPQQSVDPFAGMGIQQQQVQQPQAPVVQQPAPQGTATATEQQVQQPQQPLSYEDKVNAYLKQIPEPAPLPDISQYDGNKDEDVQKFFADFREAIVTQVEQKSERARVVQNMEREAWEEAFTQYPSLRNNKVMRDTVHAIRTGNHVNGKYITPLEAANSFLQSMGNQYNQGVVDSQVQQTIEQVQPMGGQTQAPVQFTSTTDELLAVQNGEEALAQVLANRFNSGR